MRSDRCALNSVPAVGHIAADTLSAGKSTIMKKYVNKRCMNREMFPAVFSAGDTPARSPSIGALIESTVSKLRGCHERQSMATTL
jgi:hypothetical protein